MDRKKQEFRQIEPLDEDELDADLRFLYHNRTDTVDQFVEEAIPVIKYHVNEVIAKYQDKLLSELTNHIQGEIAGVILRVRREVVLRPEKEVVGEKTSTKDW